jgi:hypothetical protein
MKKEKIFSQYLANYLAMTLFFSGFEKVFIQTFSIHEQKDYI